MSSAAAPRSIIARPDAPHPISRRAAVRGLAAGVAALATGARAAWGAEAAGVGARAELLVIALADLHSAHDRYPAILALVDRALAAHRGVPAVVALNGDLFERGNVVAVRDDGALDLAFVAALAARVPVVFNLGNHEGALFDLPEAVRRLEGAGATVVSTIADRGTGRPLAPRAATLRVGGHPVRVMGAATDDLGSYRAVVRDTLSVPDSPDAFAAALADTPGDADAPLVLLSHDGVADDRRTLHATVPDGALLVGGHDHLRLVHRAGRRCYVHAGHWGDALALLVARRDRAGRIDWMHAPVDVPRDGVRDAAFAARVRATQGRHLEARDRAPVGHARRAYAPPEAAVLGATALRDAAAADVALVLSTTFGAGLPRGAIPRHAFDAFVRFDGAVLWAEVDGATLRAMLARTNQFADVPLPRRTGDYLVASPLAGGARAVDGARRYRVVINAFAAEAPARARRLLGTDAIPFALVPGLALKRTIGARLARGV